MKGSQIQQQLTELVMEVVGLTRCPTNATSTAENEETTGPDYATEAAPTCISIHRKVSIHGGSHEIQRV